MLESLYNFLIIFRRYFYRFYIKIRFKNVFIGNGFHTDSFFNLSLHKNCILQINNNCVFTSKTKTNYVGINKKISIRVCENAELIIGNNCGFSGTSIYASKSITIGNYCNFGGNTFIWDTDFHPLHYKDRRIHKISEITSLSIKIGDDVFIGANSIILKGVTIGSRTIIGAGSVVTKDIPSDEIWAGNPIKFIRKI
jgi:acetyltransferase-like isoleucine patch superfamily enzyme